MAEPRNMIAVSSQPIGWPTHRFQHCLKTVMPSDARGANMTLLKNIKPELMPRANNKLAERWRADRTFLPPIVHHTPSPPHEPPPVSRERSLASREKPPPSRSRTSVSRSEHLDIRPPSAYSASITIKRQSNASWIANNRLDMVKLRGLLRESTYHPGNFSTLYKCTKQRIQEASDRLSYNPYERREQLILSENAGDGDGKYYSKEDIDAIVARLTAQKTERQSPQPEPSKKPNKELSPKEKEIVERLTKHKEEMAKSEEPEQKTVTKAQLEEIIKRLTEKRPDIEPHSIDLETKKVTPSQLEEILSRLMTFDNAKWPPESKPHIFKRNED